jgi:hypothetical protein
MHDSDGIEEAIEGGLRVALTAAGRVGEVLSRAWQARLDQVRAESVRAAREYTARLNAERASAIAEPAPVHQPQWWEHARVEEITRAHQVAQARKATTPEAAAAGDQDPHRGPGPVRDRRQPDACRPRGG